ncbi:MAG: response regulator transcription factor [Bacteroidales bacterium]|nr:response regulator transcription factor [Bacteroidales bacterium]
MEIKCIIIDDEPLARKLIRNHLSHFKQFNILAECENAISAAKIIQEQDVDLLFLDIQMPEINGVDFLKSLIKKPKTIITSAHKEYAIDGFNLDVIDFLLKPITLDRFFKAINKFLEISPCEKTTIHKIPQKTIEQNELFVKDTNKTYRIIPSDILYIEGMREYIKIYTNNTNIITKSSLNGFMDRLPSDLFIRIHKSFIINTQKVRAFTKTTIEIGEKKLPIGRSYKLNTLDSLNKTN